jgi:hypothetical protein
MTPPFANLAQIDTKPVFPRELFAILAPAKKVARPLPSFQALCDVLERTPMPALGQAVVEPVVLHRVYLPLERFVADTGGPSYSDFKALGKLQALRHTIPERDVPRTDFKRLGRAIQVSVQGVEGEDLKLWLSIRVGPEREEVVKISCRYERDHVRERLQQAISYLLMHPKVDHLLDDLYVGLRGSIPQRNRLDSLVTAQSFVGLHTLLVPAPMNRPGRALLDVVDHFIDRDRPAAGGVPAEDPVRHHFGVDKAGVGQDETGYALAVASNGVTNNFRFYHRKEVERGGFAWLLGELDKRIGIPKELFSKCAVCGLDWGMCTHAGNNPVSVDNDDMRVIYEKLDMPVPVYPPSYADFWYAIQDVFRKRA